MLATRLKVRFHVRTPHGVLAALRRDLLCVDAAGTGAILVWLKGLAAETRGGEVACI